MPSLHLNFVENNSGGNVYFANGQTDRTLVPYIQCMRQVAPIIQSLPSVVAKVQEFLLLQIGGQHLFQEEVG
jgi:hypothetical protein